MHGIFVIFDTVVVKCALTGRLQHLLFYATSPWIHISHLAASAVIAKS